MKRFELAVEVDAIDAETIERLKADGYSVFRGKRSWRVQVIRDVLSQDAVAAQAHAAAIEIVRDYGLSATSDPPTHFLRDPDGPMDERPDLVLADARRAEDPDPLPRPKRKWYQKAMELGLGERKGD